MHTSWFVGVAVMVVTLTQAFPVTVDTNNSTDIMTRSKTLDAVKEFFSPMTDYLFNRLPAKTPSEVATDVQEKVTNVKQWVEETKAMKGLANSLVPVKTWLKEQAITMHEKAVALQDTTFNKMYDDIKEQVSSLDHKIGTWIKGHTANQ